MTLTRERPPSGGEERTDDATFAAVWTDPSGLRGGSAVNQSYIGKRFVVTGFLFFLAGGLMALLMRTQLAVAENDVIGPQLFNQLFSMHGTVMMFLFAVPIMEGAAILLLPQMIGTRDLLFSRLTAFGYWCYLFGGLLLLSSFLFGAAPDGGWFIYPPLTGSTFSPGKAIDFWLLGITFVEISAVATAVELVVAIFKTRAPGMSLDRMPLFVWAMLVTAFMIIFGFPPLILGSIALELERAFGLPFFDPTRGGDPILWQHLFWLFGHPEVYIIFLPAAGIVSMVVPTFARTPVVGYTWIVLATVATGFISFGLWVHHMFAVGIPHLSLAFFSAASMMVAIPSGIQVFAWLATLWHGRPRFEPPLLFVVGFLIIFTIGGFTGVMVAVVPFDLQVHDSYFVVAHFHYVLIGGAVFPLFAGIYYWLPLFAGRMPSRGLGIWSFWTMFAGFNLGFFPLHLTGLLGMPRRVYTYPSGLGWEWTNLLATGGGYLFALGVLMTVANIVWTWRRGRPAPANPWDAGTLEWAGALPPKPFNFRSLPTVGERYPLWDRPQVAAAAEHGSLYLPDAPEGRRLILGTSAVTAHPEQIIELPQPTYVPLAAALAVGVFFTGFLVSLYEVAALGALLTLVAVLVWTWPEAAAADRAGFPDGRGGWLPRSTRRHGAPGWMGLALTLTADGTLYASLLFSFLFLLSFAPEWPPHGLPEPGPALATAALACQLAAAAAISWAEAGIRRGDPARLRAGMIVATALGLSFLALLGIELALLGFPPNAHAFAAIAYTIIGYAVFHQAVGLVFAGLALQEIRQGTLAPDRHLPVRLARLWWHYTAVAWALGYACIYLPPLWL